METATREGDILKAEIATVSPSAHWLLFSASGQGMLWVIGGFAQTDFVRIFRNYYLFSYFGKLEKSQQEAKLVIHSKSPSSSSGSRISLRAHLWLGIDWTKKDMQENLLLTLRKDPYRPCQCNGTAFPGLIVALWPVSSPHFSRLFCNFFGEYQIFLSSSSFPFVRSLLSG